MAHLASAQVGKTALVFAIAEDVPSIYLDLAFNDLVSKSSDVASPTLCSMLDGFERSCIVVMIQQKVELCC